MSLKTRLFDKFKEWVDAKEKEVAREKELEEIYSKTLFEQKKEVMKVKATRDARQSLLRNNSTIAVKKGKRLSMKDVSDRADNMSEIMFGSVKK